MAIYSLANRTTGVTTATPALELRTGATLRAKVLEIDVFLAAATASTYGIGRPQAIGVTPTAPVSVQPEDSADPAGSAQTALAWGTPPTIPLAFFRRIALPATIGTGVIWTFPRGLVIPAANSLVLWNLATNGVVDCNVVEDE
jgi:hypothetical protein